MALSDSTGGHLVWLAGALLFIAMHFVAEPLRWRVLFTHATSIRVWLSLFNFTAFVSYTLPFKLGVPLRLLFLSLHAHLTPSQIATGMVVDSIFYYGLWCIFGSLGFIMTARRLPLPEIPLLLWLVLGVLVVSCLIPLARKLRNRLLGSSWRDHALSALVTLTWSKVPVLSAIVVLDIGSHILRHIALVKLFGLGIDIGAIAALAVAAIFAGLLSFTPMGLGGYDAVLIAGLTQYGAPLETATLVAVSNRVLTVVVAVVLGILGAWVLRINPFDLKALRRMVAERVGRRAR